MATFNWKSGTSGDWNTGTLWTPATVPTAADDVVIDAANTFYTVTIAGGETETVQTLSMNDTVGRPGTNDAAGYHAAELILDGTLAFAPGSAGALAGPLQTYVFTDFGANASIINGGTLNAFIQVEGNLTLTGTNAVYITNEIQALGGTVTMDTPIATMAGTTLFDGIFQAKGLGAVMNLGGVGNTVNITKMEGPQDNVGGWTELTFADASSQINEWNGSAYVSIESSLTEISGGGTLDVTFGRNYTTTNTLTIDHLGSSVGAGMLNMQGVTVTTAAIDINGGIVQGYGTIASDVVNDGTMIALGGTVGGTLDVAGNLSGTGVVLFDMNAQEGAADPTKGTLVLHGVSAGQTVTMSGGDTLELATPGAFAGTIVAGIGDKIVLDGLTATSATLNNGTLVVSNGSVTVASLALAGNYTGDSIATNGSILTFGTAVAPGISGTAAGQAVTDAGTVSPFANVTIQDANVGQTETVTITLSAAANGTLTNLGNGTYDSTTGVYTDTGSAASVTADLHALLFTPTAHQVAPGQAVTTTFTISDTDTASLTASDASTTVIATAGTVAPVIGGTVPNQTTNDLTPVTPFAGVTIGDANAGQTETVTITLSAAANGTLSNLGSGTYDPTTGVYTDTGSAAAVAADLHALLFTPTAHQSASGQSVTTTFTISDTDTAGATATDAATSVVTTATSVSTPGAGSGDAMNLAAQITAQLTALGNAGTLRVTTDSDASPPPNAPPVGPGTANELVLNGPGGLGATIPAGYSHVLAQSDTADTIHGANIVLVGGPAGGAYGVSGNSTVVATGGNNLIFATDSFTVSTADGNNTVSASGNGTVATDHGANLIFAAGSTTVLSVGQDTIVGGAGTTAVQSSGSNTLIFGQFGGSNGVMDLALSGGAVTVSGGNSSVTTTLTGSNGLIFGAANGGGTLNVVDQGTADTISGLTSATTVTGGAGSSGLLVFGGSGGLDFVGGASAATVMTSAGQNAIKVGSGGLLLAAGGNDNITGDGGAVTLFGSANNAVTYSAAGSLLYGAGSGNETLNAAGSTGNGTYFAGAGPSANDAIIGGSGTNIFVAGGGSDTFTGGSGTNIFDFMASNTAGHAEFIINMTASDSVNLIGYDPTKSTVSTAGGSTTLTLSDKTQITFVSLANLPGSIHYA